jgi:hypothetical protein
VVAERPDEGLEPIALNARPSPVCFADTAKFVTRNGARREIPLNLPSPVREKVVAERPDEGLEPIALNARPSPVCSADTLSLRERDDIAHTKITASPPTRS